MKNLATIGYEDASIEDFIATLKLANVERIIDVRNVPTSRRKGFSKNQLSNALASAEIQYVHLKALGDPKKGRKAARSGAIEEFKKIFSAHLRTKSARAALAEAAELAKQGDSCRLCYERDNNVCHKTMVADSIKYILKLEIRHLGVRGGLSRRDKFVSIRKISRVGEGTPSCREVAR